MGRGVRAPGPPAQIGGVAVTDQLPKLKPSSERFDATKHETSEDIVMSLYHRYAYEVAARSLERGDRVLDVGFGEGYGAPIIGGDYLGVEVDGDLVAHARARYTGRFQTYDGLHLPDGPFELVVSFHVIEHVHDVEPWLSEIARVARRAMFATPNRTQRLREGEQPWNRYHVREFTAGELQGLLMRHFTDVVVHGICASPEIEAVELARYARARQIARFDRLGLRYRLPSSADAWVRSRLRKPDARAQRDFTLDEFSHSEAWAESALVLLAEAR